MSCRCAIAMKKHRKAAAKTRKTAKTRKARRAVGGAVMARVHRIEQTVQQHTLELGRHKAAIMKMAERIGTLDRIAHRRRAG